MEAIEQFNQVEFDGEWMQHTPTYKTIEGLIKWVGSIEKTAKTSA